MNTAGSVSKGIFAFKGKKQKVDIQQEYDSSINERKLLGVEQLEILSKITEEFLVSQNQNMLRDVIQFFLNCQQSLCQQSSLIRQLEEIPTVALVKGINIPDHSALFTTLQKDLVDKVTPYVVHLQSSDSVNTRNLLSAIIRQLLCSSQLTLDEDEDTEESGFTSSANRVCSAVDTILAWHESKKKANSSLPLLVLILEDFEAFPAHVVSDLVTIFSGHINQMPVINVFGLSTSVKVLSATLPKQVMCMLDITCFQLPSSSSLLDELIQKTLMSKDTAFKVGYRVFNLLLDNFLCHNFSAVGFVTSLKYCLLDHYHDNAASILCRPLVEAQKKIKILSKSDLQDIKRLLSFQQYVINLPDLDKLKLKGSDDYLKEIINELLIKLHIYIKEFFTAVKYLHCCAFQLPNCPLGKQLREVLSACLTSNIVEAPSYLKVCELLRCLSRETLIATIDRCLEISSDISDIKEQLSSFKTSLVTLEDNLDKMNDEDLNESGMQIDTPVYKNRAERILSRHREAPQSKKLSIMYANLRAKVIDYLDSIFRKYLPCPKNVPLNEVLFYHGSNDITHRLCGSHRGALQTALSKPHLYMDELEDGHEPDLCVAYRLHLECGRLINLQDWMQAFTVIVQPINVQPPPKKKRKQSVETESKVLQARFIRSVAELQFLGFIKSTKRKTDHVQRLTWGGC